MRMRRRPPEWSLPRLPPLLALIKIIEEHERHASGGRVEKTKRKGKTRMIKRGAKNGWDVQICALYS
ncbi:hypothetical protein NC652_003367 [Populus alba x Populus x berolinensis]|nr:hypothetical protein NC652_003367 [Populus alba x Populus x berolinensis]